METESLFEKLNIRYIKLHFTLEIAEDTLLPPNKVSMLRGGMGEMLLKINCVRDRKCENCDFAKECIVRRTMYSEMEIRPSFMNTQDSEGYILECENYEKEFYEGDHLNFNLILFGKTIVYFSQFLQAFQYLGMYGIGAEKARYQIVSVTNTRGEDLVCGNDVYMQNFKIDYLKSYVKYRLGKTDSSSRIVFHSPLSLKYKGTFINEFSSEAILQGAERRLYIMNCFEGNDCGRIDIADHIPLLQPVRTVPMGVTRYSSTHEGHMTLRGIAGFADMDNIDETARIILLAGELLHIGKNTRFGFGRYTLV